MTLIAYLTAHGPSFWKQERKSWQRVAATGQQHAASIRVVTDLATESCLAIDVPARLSRADRHLYLEQQLQQHHPHTPYRRAIASHAMRQRWFTRQGTAADKLHPPASQPAALFALTLEETDQTWLQQPDLQQAEIYPATLLLSLLAKDEPHLLIAHQGSAGLRLVYCQRGLPLLSRLVEGSGTHSAADELLRTRQHIERHHGLAREDELAILPRNWSAAQLADCQQALGSISLHWLVGSRPHASISSPDLGADSELFELAGRQPTTARIASDSQRASQMSRRRLKYVQVAASLLMLTSLAMTCAELSSYRQQQQQAEVLQAEIRQLQMQKEPLETQRPPHAIQAEDLRQLLSWPALAAREGASTDITGIETFAQQLHALAQRLEPAQTDQTVPILRLHQLRWQAAIDPEQACAATVIPLQTDVTADRHGTAATTTDTVSELQFSLGFQTRQASTEPASINGSIDIDASQALAQLRALAARLTQWPGMQLAQQPEVLAASWHKSPAGWQAQEQRWCLTGPSSSDPKIRLERNASMAASHQQNRSVSFALPHPDSRETPNKWLRRRIPALHGARSLAYPFDMSRSLCAAFTPRLALPPPHSFLQRLPAWPGAEAS